MWQQRWICKSRKMWPVNQEEYEHWFVVLATTPPMPESVRGFKL